MAANQRLLDAVAEGRVLPNSPAAREAVAQAARPLPRHPRDVPVSSVPIAPDKPAVPDKENPNAIRLGDAEFGGALQLDLAKLIDGRLLVQGISGAGKSWTLRRILEQSAKRIQHIVIDPEGEFKSLAETLGHLLVDASRLDGAALRALGTRARETRISMVLDFSELDREGQMRALASLFEALVQAPREHWSPVMVVVDEAHIFAPWGGQVSEGAAVRKAAIAALTDLMSRGRKRGLCGVLATQRLARLAKSVASEAHNALIGLNTLDLDIKRAAETIGWDLRRASDRLPMLEPGRFVAVGPAFSQSPVGVKVGPVESRHSGAAPALVTTAVTVTTDEARAMLGLDDLMTQSAPAPSPVTRFIDDPSAPLAGRILQALVLAAPLGRPADRLMFELQSNRQDVERALALLRERHAVELVSDVVQLGAPDALAELVGDVVRQLTSGLSRRIVTGLRGWTSQEDRILTEGYRANKAGREIADALEAAGMRRRSLGNISARAQHLGLSSNKLRAAYSPEEDAIIRAGYAGEVRLMDIVANLAEAGFERGRVSVQMRAIHLGVTRDRVNYWTEPEKAIAIAGLEAGKPHREILADLKAAGYERGVTSILKFAQKHNFSRAPDSWTPEEIEILKQRYEAKVPARAIAEELGKTQAAVRSRASLLGIKQRFAWTEAERSILVNAHKNGESLVSAAANIGRPYINVAAEARRLNLSFRKTPHGDGVS